MCDSQTHAGELTEALSNFGRDGFVVFENAIELGFISELKEALHKTERELNIAGRDTDFKGHQTIRIYNRLAHGEAYWKVPTHKAVLPFAAALLASELQLSSLSAITLWRGQGTQPLHADDQPIPVAKPHQPATPNAVWAISDLREDNGADTNRTDERRFSISNYYCAGFMRQQENHQLGIAVDITKQFPRRLQEPCGYAVYTGMYGHLDNEDPITVLGRRSETKMVWQQSYADMFEKQRQAEG